MKRIKQHWVLVWLPLLLVLALVACNGDDETLETAVSVEVDAAAEAEQIEPPDNTPTPEPEAIAIESETATIDEPAEATAEPEPEPEPEAAQQPTTFRIDPGQSEARFTIDEILRGEPFTVVGVTNQVTGDLTIDLTNPDQSRVAEISVDASTLATDSSLRDRAIYNFILNTSIYQFVRFEPTTLTGLPTTINVGDTVEFQIEGELTIRDITQVVVFDTAVTLVSEQMIQGQASTTILRDEFDLSIPSVPQVAGVDEELTLELEFVATAVP